MQKAQLMLVRAEDGKLRIKRQVQHLSVASIRLLFGVVTIEKSTHEYQDRDFLLSTFSEVRRVHLIGGLGYLLTSGGFAQLCKLRTYLLPGALPNCPKRVLTYFRGGVGLKSSSESY